MNFYRFRAVSVALSALLFVYVGIPANTTEMCPRGDRYTCVVDGDTLWLDGINYQLEGYDTPEEHTNVCGGFTEIDLARVATRRFIDLFNQNEWVLHPRRRADRYGRVLANNSTSGEDVGDILVREGLARY